MGIWNDLYPRRSIGLLLSTFEPQKCIFEPLDFWKPITGNLRETRYIRTVFFLERKLDLSRGVPPHFGEILLEDTYLVWMNLSVYNC